MLSLLRPNYNICMLYKDTNNDVGYYFVVHLINGSTKFEGRVEVNYNGAWGTVCDDGWDLNDAQVVCNELDYGKAVSAQHGAVYGLGSGQIWLDNVNCVGTEGTIGNCSHNGWGSHDCGHGEDASVNCTAGMYAGDKTCI